MSYSREAAVNYAFQYYKNPNPIYQYFNVYGDDGGDCTNFVSQCLHAGGFEMVKDNPEWWYNTNNHSYSLSWSVANLLYNCLKKRAEEKDTGPRGIEVKSLEELYYGDLIFYRNQNNRVNHVAIVTGFYQGKPVITQHSPDVANISYYKPHKTGMHFIKIIDD